MHDHAHDYLHLRRLNPVSLPTIKWLPTRKSLGITSPGTATLRGQGCRDLRIAATASGEEKIRNHQHEIR